MWYSVCIGYYGLFSGIFILYKFPVPGQKWQTRLPAPGGLNVLGTQENRVLGCQAKGKQILS